MTSNLFIPTYLYIKRHSVTGKLYFGKTVGDPEIYNGSGKHWKRHIKLHGVEYVETLWYCLFLDQEQCTEFALNFSRQNNIVYSDDWLNLIDENGLNGGSPSRAGSKHSQESKVKISNSLSGKQVSPETKMKMSASKRGKSQPIYECPHCGKVGKGNAMKHYHFNNCRFKSPAPTTSGASSCEPSNS